MIQQQSTHTLGVIRELINDYGMNALHDLDRAIDIQSALEQMAVGNSQRAYIVILFMIGYTYQEIAIGLQRSESAICEELNAGFLELMASIAVSDHKLYTYITKDRFATEKKRKLEKFLKFYTETWKLELKEIVNDFNTTAATTSSD